VATLEDGHFRNGCRSSQPRRSTAPQNQPTQTVARRRRRFLLLPICHPRPPGKAAIRMSSNPSPLTSPTSLTELPDLSPMSVPSSRKPLKPSNDGRSNGSGAANRARSSSSSTAAATSPRAAHYAHGSQRFSTDRSRSSVLPNSHLDEHGISQGVPPKRGGGGRFSSWAAGGAPRVHEAAGWLTRPP